MKRLAVSLTVLLAIAAGVVAAAGAAVRQHHAARLTDVNVSYSGVDSETLPAFVAQDSGLTTKNGLNVNLQVLNSTAGVAALLKGDVQIANIGGSEVLAADAAGSDLIIVANYAPLSDYRLYVPASITTAAQLKGKKIGISQFGSTSWVGTVEALRSLHMSSSDVQLIAVGSHSARTAAALSGQISAAVDYPPGSLQLEKAGWHALVNLQTAGYASEGEDVVVTRAYLQSHRDVVQEYVNSIIQASSVIRKNEALSVNVLLKYFQSTDMPTFQATWKELHNIFPAYPFPRAYQYGNAIKYGSEKIPALLGLKVGNYLDPSFVANAANRALVGLTQSAYDKALAKAKRAENRQIVTCKRVDKGKKAALQRCVANAKKQFTKQAAKLKKQLAS
jgi:ABC-type nitrate/sulfonate/bicarbonate transport system substrate-binding protein